MIVPDDSTIGLLTLYYNFNVSRLKCFSPQRDLLYSWCRQDGLLVEAAVLYGVATLQSQDVKINQRQAIQSRQTLYAGINRRIAAERNDPSWGLIMLVCAAIATICEGEDPDRHDIERAKELQAHIEGFRVIARLKGGWGRVAFGTGAPAWMCYWFAIPT